MRENKKKRKSEANEIEERERSERKSVRIMEREIVRKVNSDQSLKNVLSRITLATQLLLYSWAHTVYISYVSQV